MKKENRMKTDLEGKRFERASMLGWALFVKFLKFLAAAGAVFLLARLSTGEFGPGDSVQGVRISPSDFR